LKEPSASVLRDKNSKDSDSGDEGSKNPRNVGRELPTQGYVVACRNTQVFMYSAVRTSHVYRGVFCVVVLLVPVLGNASESIASAVSWSTLESEHCDISHSDKNVGLPSVGLNRSRQ
jgi:hypothetical protein